MGRNMVKQNKNKKPEGAKTLKDSSTATLTDKQREVLDNLACMRDWAAPMYFGGRDGSHHSDTLRRLVSLGLAERKKLHAINCYYGCTQRQTLIDGSWVTSHGHPPSTKCCCKGSCRYRITPAGRKALAA